MQRYREEAKKLTKLAIPVLLASVSQTGMSVVDTIMSGDISETDLAAVGVASSIWMPSILFGIGILLALIPIVAQLQGSGRNKRISFQIHQGVYLALLVSIPIILVLTQTQHILTIMEVEPMMAEKTKGYMSAMVFAVPAFLFFQVLRCLSEGLSHTKPAMVIGFLGLLLNIPLNWVFVYGKFGMPQLGAVGCGIATVIVYWCMFFAMLFYVYRTKRFKSLNLFTQIYAPQKDAIFRLIRLGLPIAAAIFFEVTLFAVVALLIAPFGPNVVAAHQVAINFSSVVFMLPLSLGIALSIRVGNQLGARLVDGAKVASRVGVVLGLGISVITAIFTIVFKYEITQLYNVEEQEVIEIAMTLLLLSALYQCTDALQVVAGGALRGYKEMSAIFTRTFVSYWIIGMPLSYVLGISDWIFDEPLGVYGCWIGIVVGLTCAGFSLAKRLHWVHQQPEHVQISFGKR